MAFGVAIILEWSASGADRLASCGSRGIGDAGPRDSRLASGGSRGFAGARPRDPRLDEDRRLREVVGHYEPGPS